MHLELLMKRLLAVQPNIANIMLLNVQLPLIPVIIACRNVAVRWMCGVVGLPPHFPRTPPHGNVFVCMGDSFGMIESSAGIIDIIDNVWVKT